MVSLEQKCRSGIIEVSKRFYDIFTGVAIRVVRCDFFVVECFGLLVASY
jgi:hypothetical protein